MRDRLPTRRRLVAVAAALVVAPIAVLPRATAQVPAATASSSAPSSPPAASSSSASTASTPQPEAAPEQVVWLNNGGIVRGQIVELVPNDHVTLQLATGEIRSVPWSDIARSSFIAPTSSEAARPAAPPSASQPPAAAPPAAGVRVEILGDRDGLWLESRRRFTDDPWTLACRAPCEHPIEVGDKSLRIAGPGTRPSNPFFIDGHGGKEVLVVRTGDAQTHAWGQRSLVAGIGFGLAGGAAFGLGKVEDSDPAVVGGIIGMALGGALVALALPLLGASSTHVRNSKGDRIGRADGTFVW